MLATRPSGTRPRESSASAVRRTAVRGLVRTRWLLMSTTKTSLALEVGAPPVVVVPRFRGVVRAPLTSTVTAQGSKSLSRQ